MAGHTTHRDSAPLVCRLRIRPLLLLVFGTTAAVALIALAWSALYAWRQLDTATWLSRTNQVADTAMRLGAAAALERGLTAIQLGHAAARRPLSDTLQPRREAVDHLYRELVSGSSALLAIAEIPGLREQDHTIAARRFELEKMRHAVDRWLKAPEGRAPPWFDSASRFIDAVGELRRAALTPIDPTAHALRNSLLLKEAFHAVTEYAGRERGLIAGVIAEGRPFSDAEQQRLLRYQGAAERALTVISGELDPFGDPIDAAFPEPFDRLRRAVYRAGRDGTPYPVTAEQWFGEATDAIDRLLALSENSGNHISEGIEALRREAVAITVALGASVLLTLMLFAGAFTASYRRILIPLRRLERAAEAIADGDLEQSVNIASDDEFGRLGETFERMRLKLRHDIVELRKLGQALDQSVSSVIITDPNGTVEYVNPQFTRTTGYTADEVLGSKANRLKSGRTPNTKYRELWNTIHAGEVWQDELLNRRKDGELYWDQIAISPVKEADGRITHFVSIQHDITERKRMEERLHFVAYHDELTELPNRALLADRFQQAVHRARRGDRSVALLLLDLDRFKLVNDSLGHSVGDRLLVEVAERLVACARAEDTVARYGGDEFVVLLTDLDSTATAADAAQRLLDAVARPLEMEGTELRPTASLGVALWPQDGDDLEALLSNADAAMFRAKELGRDRPHFYTAELNGEAGARLDLEHALRRAVESEAFELHYQPQVELESGRIVGVEALIRWRRPGNGWVPPDRFIPLAEETGLILPIGRWVLQRACAQLAEWRAAGQETLTMAVNVSPRQLEQEELAAEVERLLAEHQLPPERLELELTEGAVMHHPERALKALLALKELGVQLALDDFGTGYSSLTYLHRFPFDKLKIDRAFVRNITHQPDEAAIALTIGAMARSLRLNLIAEGVESEGQACYLRRHGCNHVQGYYYSPPLPGERLDELLRDTPFGTVGCNGADARPVVLWIGGEEGHAPLHEALRDTPPRLITAADTVEGFEQLAIHEVQLLFCAAGPGADELLGRVGELYPRVAARALDEGEEPEALREEIMRRLENR